LRDATLAKCFVQSYKLGTENLLTIKYFDLNYFLKNHIIIYSVSQSIFLEIL